MVSNNPHVFSGPEGWTVSVEGEQEMGIICEDREEALQLAAALAESDRAEVVVHDEDGRVKEWLSPMQARGVTA